MVAQRTDTASSFHSSPSSVDKYVSEEWGAIFISMMDLEYLQFLLLPVSSSRFSRSQSMEMEDFPQHYSSDSAGRFLLI